MYIQRNHIRDIRKVVSRACDLNGHGKAGISGNRKRQFAPQSAFQIAFSTQHIHNGEPGGEAFEQRKSTPTVFENGTKVLLKAGTFKDFTLHLLS